MACFPEVDFIVMPAILIYIATLITEIVSSVPVGLVQNDFNGNCILSATVHYFDSGFPPSIVPDNKTMIVDSFGNKSLCGFCTYLTIFTVLFCLAYGSYSAFAIYQDVKNAFQMWVLPAILANILLFVLKFVSSCMLSVGVSQLCGSITSNDQVENCKDGQGLNWVSADGEAYDGGRYDTYLTTAQSASWFSVMEWFLLSGFAVLHYRRNLAHRSGGQVTSGFGASDTTGVVANEYLPGSSVSNPNYKRFENET